MKKLLTSVLLMLLGCSVAKKELSTSKIKESASAQLVMAEDVLLQRVSKTDDSLHTDFEYKIWPKGKFKLGAIAGFEGEALAVQINGKTEQVKKLLDVDRITHQKTLRLKSNAKKLVNTQQKDVFKLRPTWGILMLIAVILLLGMYYYRKWYAK